MLLNDIILIIDPIKILPEDEAQYLLNADNYEEAWNDIKARHKVTTNISYDDRFTVRDIFYFHKNEFKITSKDIPDDIPDIKTESGFLVGIEFKDLKKLNKDIDDDDVSIFDGAFATSSFRASIGFGSDLEGEYITATISVPNPDYDSTDENSHKNVCYYLEWENSYVEDFDEEEIDNSLESDKSEND